MSQQAESSLTFDALTPVYEGPHAGAPGVTVAAMEGHVALALRKDGEAFYVVLRATDAGHLALNLLRLARDAHAVELGAGTMQ